MSAKRQIVYSDAGAIARKQDWEDRRRRAYRGPYVMIPLQAKITNATRTEADAVFERDIRESPVLKKYKLDQKREFFRKVFHAGKAAALKDGCVAYSRDLDRAGCSNINIQVVEAAVERGYFAEFRSPPGSPQMSRLEPTLKLADVSEMDPRTVHPNEQALVLLTDRKTGADLHVDRSHPVVKDVWEKLSALNVLLDDFKITYHKWSALDNKFRKWHRLTPVHFARFSDDYETHGRIYTAQHGHQGLRQFERATIRFNGQPSVELDYSGLHTRMLYHMEGIDYRADPYLLWGDETNEDMRLIAKVFINALINAETPEAAVDACNRKMSRKTSDGGRKRGVAYDKAKSLYEASKRSGLKFSALLPVVYRAHRPVRHYFGLDMGIKLMRTDSKIALDILSHFTEECVPCLGVHDSFIVPYYGEEGLRHIMRKAYRDQLGYAPKIG